MKSADLARQICEDLGIAWDEAGAFATVNGVPIDNDTLYSYFFRSTDDFYTNVTLPVRSESNQTRTYCCSVCAVSKQNKVPFNYINGNTAFSAA